MTYTKKLKKKLALSLSFVLALSILIFVIMLLFNVTDYGISIASFAATVFMILSKKNLSKRKIFGAYAISALCGFVFSHVNVAALNVALATVFSFITLTLLEFQHPPAIGISVALVLNEFGFWTDIIVLMCIFIIFALALVLKIFMDDPSKLYNFVEIEEEKIDWKLHKRASRY